MLSLITSVALAGPLVIVQTQDLQTPELESSVETGTKFLTWEETRALPSILSQVSDTQRCSGSAATIEAVKESLKSAESALSYMENQNVLGFHRVIQANILCLSEPIPPDLISRASYVAGVALYQEGKTAEAKKFWRDALVYQPDLAWDEYIEPSGKTTFDEVKESLKYEPQGSLTFIPSSANLLIDGQKKETGSGILAGSHFVQQVQRDHSVQSFQTDLGSGGTIVSLADFEPDLGVVMASESQRIELLKGLQLLEPTSDLRVITTSDSWYLAPGASEWKKSTANNASAANTRTKKTKSGGLANMPQAKKTMLYSGLATSALGVGALTVAQIQYSRFNSYDAATPEDDVRATYRSQRRLWASGVGLAAVGVGLTVSSTF